MRLLFQWKLFISEKEIEFFLLSIIDSFSSLLDWDDENDDRDKLERDNLLLVFIVGNLIEFSLKYFSFSKVNNSVCFLFNELLLYSIIFRIKL